MYVKKMKSFFYILIAEQFFQISYGQQSTVTKDVNDPRNCRDKQAASTLVFSNCQFYDSTLPKCGSMKGDELKDCWCNQDVFNAMIGYVVEFRTRH
jgi:hypothetical protein